VCRLVATRKFPEAKVSGRRYTLRHDVRTLRIPVRIATEEKAAFAASCGEPSCSELLNMTPFFIRRRKHMTASRPLSRNGQHTLDNRKDRRWFEQLHILGSFCSNCPLPFRSSCILWPCFAGQWSHTGDPCLLGCGVQYCWIQEETCFGISIMIFWHFEIRCRESADSRLSRQTELSSRTDPNFLEMPGKHIMY